MRAARNAARHPAVPATGINRQVARELQRRGFKVVVFEDAELWAEMAREDGVECMECLVSDPEADGALEGAEAFVLMDADTFEFLDTSW